MRPFKHAGRIGHLKGIAIPHCNSQQIISQYVDDTSFIVKAHESSVGTLVGILHKFGLVYDLEMNWHKKCGMLVRPMNPTKLSGEISVDVGCKWRFVKILGTPFGLYL